MYDWMRDMQEAGEDLSEFAHLVNPSDSSAYDQMRQEVENRFSYQEADWTAWERQSMDNFMQQGAGVFPEDNIADDFAKLDFNDFGSFFGGYGWD